MIDVIKRPYEENDDFLIMIDEFYINEAKKINDPYIDLKMNKFFDKDISKEGFEDFKDRLSLRNMDNLKDLRGSIYTFSVEERNSIPISQILLQVKELLSVGSRRAVVRMANPISEYYRSQVKSNLDVSCLSMIHYLKNQVRLVFRACDVRDETFADIVTIWWHFLKPIYRNPISLKIYGSTTQNHEYFDLLIENIQKKICEMKP